MRNGKKPGLAEAELIACSARREPIKLLDRRRKSPAGAP
jgi:hypothetical protein